jgi:uncharacterized protein (TIGR03437 family)
MPAPLLADGSIVPMTSDTPTPVLPVTVTIGGTSAELLYVGSVPGQAIGLLQINVRLPQGLFSGAQPVMLTVGAASSLPGVTVAIR